MTFINQKSIVTDPFNEQLTKILKTNVCLVKTIVTMPFNEQLTGIYVNFDFENKCMHRARLVHMLKN